MECVTCDDKTPVYWLFTCWSVNQKLTCDLDLKLKQNHKKWSTEQSGYNKHCTVGNFWWRNVLNAFLSTVDFSFSGLQKGGGGEKTNCVCLIRTNLGFIWETCIMRQPFHLPSDTVWIPGTLLELRCTGRRRRGGGPGQYNKPFKHLYTVPLFFKSQVIGAQECMEYIYYYL